MSFRLSFHPASFRPTRAHWLDDPPDLTCQDSTGQHAVDDPLLSCKQQVADLLLGSLLSVRLLVRTLVLPRSQAHSLDGTSALTCVETTSQHPLDGLHGTHKSPGHRFEAQPPLATSVGPLLGSRRAWLGTALPHSRLRLFSMLPRYIRPVRDRQQIGSK